jgi:hypothetical protein
MFTPWTELVSSNVRRVRWDRDTCVLELEFNGGRVYQYFDVPQQVFEGLLAATDSHGSYFIQNIKGSYRYVRV